MVVVLNVMCLRVLLRLFGFEPVKCLCKRGWKCRVVIMTWACGYISEPLGDCFYKDCISAWLGILFLAFSYKMLWDKER